MVSNSAFGIFFATIFYCAASNPIIIRSGINKNHGRSDLSNNYEEMHHKGLANFEGDEGFNKNNEHKIVKAQDNGHYGEENGKKSQNMDENNYNDEKYFQDDGGHVSEFGSKLAHKKGHHKTGFHNTYHKDESGSNSSFFDDAGDEGDEIVRKTKKGSFGDTAHQRQQGGNLNQAHYLQDQGKHGRYDNSGNYQKDLANQQNYNRKNYYDNRQNQARHKDDNRFGEDARFAEEKFVQRRPDDYYYDRQRPLIGDVGQKKRITIYEDPRVYDYDQPHYYNNNYGNDYVEIEVKRPDYRRYHDYDRPIYYY